MVPNQHQFQESDSHTVIIPIPKATASGYRSCPSLVAAASGYRSCPSLVAAASGYSSDTYTGPLQESPAKTYIRQLVVHRLEVIQYLLHLQVVVVLRVGSSYVISDCYQGLSI